jgi:hypothetical protein
MTVRIQKPAVNIREKLAELERPIGLNGAALMRTETPQEAFSLIGAGRRNLIINGGFDVWQRGTSGTVGSGTRSYSSADRWFNYNSGDSTVRVDVSGESIGGVTGRFNYAIKVTGSQSSRILGQCIEGPLPAGNYVYSAWVKFVGSVPPNFYFTNNSTALTSANNFAGFYGGSGASINYAQPDNWSEISTPGVWYKIYRKITPVSPHLGLGLAFQPVWSSSTSSEFWVTGVQVEKGTLATEFEHRSYGEELALCQRYCIVYGGAGTRHLGIASMYTSTAVNITLCTPTTMRDQPVLTKVLNGNSQWLQVYVGAIGTNSNATIEMGEGGSTNNFRLYCTGAHSGSTTGYAAWVQILAGAKLILNAEL